MNGFMYEWMDGFMDEWMDGLMRRMDDGSIDGWMDKWCTLMLQWKMYLLFGEWGRGYFFHC